MMFSVPSLVRSRILPLLTAGLALSAMPAQAMELHWSGNFWSEFHYLKNYTDNSGGFDTARTVGGQPAGYYNPGGGSSSASFETLFLRVRPKLIINDNISIKSEWWAGDPAFGVFGNAYPWSSSQRYYNSNQSRGSFVTAQRFWAELLTDVGTVQIGRVPLQWGLGLVWNSGEELYSRFESTGDAIRLISKFGAFTFSPGFVLYSAGNNLGGSCAMGAGGVCTPTSGSGGVADYSIQLKYENLEEDFEGGVHFLKRLAGTQDAGSSLGPWGTAATANYNTWDIYGRKRIGAFTIGGELPISSGSVGPSDYSAVAFAADVQWKISEAWETQLKAGLAPGQPNDGTATPSRYRAFYFHPNYKVGNIMFNYQLANLAGYPGGNTQNSANATAANLRSAFDNPIVNAQYLAWSGAFKTQKWVFNLGFVWAQAPQAAQAGSYYFNTRQRQMVLAAGTVNQSKSLGWEIDTGAGFQWDDNFSFKVDFGFYFPGDFYKYTGLASDATNGTDMVFGTTARVGITF